MYLIYINKTRANIRQVIRPNYGSEGLPHEEGEATAWCGANRKNFHRICYTEEHRYCTDQYYQTLYPWHRYIEIHTHQILSGDENHIC